MADVHSKATRSYNMSRIRSKDTKPEMRLREFSHISENALSHRHQIGKL